MWIRPKKSSRFSPTIDSPVSASGIRCAGGATNQQARPNTTMKIFLSSKIKKVYAVASDHRAALDLATRELYSMATEVPDSGYRGMCEVMEANGYALVMSDDSKPDEDTSLRDAAPDLLKSLQEIVNHATTFGGAPLSATKMFDRAREAIAKATKPSRCTCGRESDGPVPNYCPEHDGDYSSFLAINNCD